MKNKLMTEDEFKKSFRDIEQSIAFVKEVREMTPENWSIPDELSKYKLGTYIVKLEERRDLMVKQYACDHKNNTGLEYSGHDSHYDHHKNICKDCGFELEFKTV